MKRISEIVMTVCFVGVLLAGLYLTHTHEPEAVSYWENRTLAQEPERSWEALADGSYTTQYEKYLSDQAVLRTTLLMSKARLDLLLHRPVVNDVVVTDSALLPYLPYTPAYLPQIERAADNMAARLEEISAVAAENGAYFCYVAVPCQSVSRQDDYPWFLNNQQDYADAKSLYLAQAMEERGVPFLDVQAALAQTGESYDQYASRVDNHYSMQGAFQTYRLVMEKIVADTGLEFPILTEDDFQLITLPNEYLGSRERKLLNQKQVDEHLSVLWPREWVPFVRSDNWKLTDPPFIYDMPETEEEIVSYDLYMGGDMARTVIDTGREDLPSILVYGDSFTNPFECLAYLSFDKMHSIDLRHYQDRSLEDYIRLFQPDVVVCIRDYDFLLDLQGNGGGEPEEAP